MESSTNLLERISTGSDKETASSSINPSGNDQDSGLASSAEMTNTPVAQSAAGDDVDEDIFEQVTMILRKRRGWGPQDSLSPSGLDLDLLEDDDELVEEDDAGCPLPSTPEDTQLIEAEVSWMSQPQSAVCKTKLPQHAVCYRRLTQWPLLPMQNI